MEWWAWTAIGVAIFLVWLLVGLFIARGIGLIARDPWDDWFNQ